MKTRLLASCAILLAVSAASAHAQVTFSYGATLTSDYISRGLTQTANGVALQPWVEASSGGWYGGLWLSNVDIAPDTIEVDLYGGYRWSIGNTGVDLGYARYIYNSTGDAGGEIYLLGEHQAGDLTMFAGVYLGHVGGITLNDVHVGFNVPLYGSLSGGATAGRAAGGISYGDIGVTYDVNANVSLDARYMASTAQPNRFVFSASVAF